MQSLFLLSSSWLPPPSLAHGFMIFGPLQGLKWFIRLRLEGKFEEQCGPPVALAHCNDNKIPDLKPHHSNAIVGGVYWRCELQIRSPRTKKLIWILMNVLKGLSSSLNQKKKKIQLCQVLEKGFGYSRVVARLSALLVVCWQRHSVNAVCLFNPTHSNE